jgi:multidrug resistance protein, MATE family
MRELEPALTRADVLRKAWPIIVANATSPLLGLVDTAVIGNTGGVLDLGAIALGTLVFNFLYFGLNFLRMATTGFVAQSAGARDEAEVRAVVGRAALFAAAIGCGLLALAQPLTALSIGLLHGSAAVEDVARQYVHIRLWSAPATLVLLVARGALIGLGRSRDLLRLELAINGLNLALDLWFAGVLRWGAEGVALGSALAEWGGLLLASAIVVRRLRERRSDGEPFWPWARMRQRAELSRMFGANADMLLRTLLLLFGFGWFTDRSAHFGDATLAANHVLLQFLSFVAFFLDGYANVAESLIGSAIGAGRRADFDLAVRRSSELAAVSALVLALSIWLIGPQLIAGLTDLEPVRATARQYLPFCAMYAAVSVAAFQLDGIFIGATHTRDMRNAALLSTGVFVAAAWALTAWAGVYGLWLAFILFVIVRALALAAHFPALRASIGVGPSQ